MDWQWELPRGFDSFLAVTVRRTLFSLDHAIHSSTIHLLPPNLFVHICWPKEKKRIDVPA